MSTQRFVPWTPMADVPETLYCEGIHDGPDGLRITLQSPPGDGPALQVTFEGVVAYRNINESWRARTWQHLDLKALPTLLRVDDSKWVAWLVEEAGGALSFADLTHYAIYTPEDCIDVVTESTPEVIWLEGDTR